MEIPSGASLVAQATFIQVDGVSCYPEWSWSSSPYLPPPFQIGWSCTSPAVLQVDSGGTLNLVSSTLNIYGIVVVQSSGHLNFDASDSINELTNSSCTADNGCSPPDPTGVLQNGGTNTGPTVVSVTGSVDINTSNGGTNCPLYLGGAWSGTTCSVEQGFSISTGAILNIANGVSVTGGSFSLGETQIGILDSGGTINNHGTLTGICNTGGTCYGILTNGGSTINNYGTIIGEGNGGDGINNVGTINNYGTLNGPGNGIANYGEINNYDFMTGTGYSGNAGIYNQGDLLNLGTMSTSGSNIYNIKSGGIGYILNSGTIASGGGIQNTCDTSGEVLSNCGTIDNDGTITSSALVGDGGYDIQNLGTINNYCGHSLSATLDTISNHPTSTACYTVTLKQVGVPSGAQWEVATSWGPFLPFGVYQHYTSTGSSVTTQITGYLIYAYGTPITVSGVSHYCSSGCNSAVNLLISAPATFTATYLVSTTTTVSCSPSSVNGASTTQCTANVSGSSPTGTVTFRSSSGSGYFSPVNGQCTLSSGSCTVTYTDPQQGSPTITAAYGGDSINGPSSGTTSPTILTTVYYKVTFSITGVPTGDLASWGVSVNGAENTQTKAGTTSLTLNVLAYPQPYQFDPSISAGSAGLFFCTSGCSGTISGSATITAGYISGAILSQQTCGPVIGGSWSGSTCTTSTGGIGSGQTLRIPNGVTLAIDGLGSVSNDGQITIDQGGALILNGGGYSDNGLTTQLTNHGTIVNSGTIGIYSSATDHYRDGNDGIDNYGTITNTNTGVISVENSGDGVGATTLGLYNLGTVLNSGIVNVEGSADVSGAGSNGAGSSQYGIYNSGTFTNQGCGLLTGNNSDSYGVAIPSGGCTVNFSQAGIPSTGVTWGVTVGGTDHTGTGSSITVNFISYAESFSFDSPISSAGAQFTCSTGCSGSVSGSTTMSATYTGVFQVTLSTTPSQSSVTLSSLAVTLKDAASLGSGTSPTGTITFTLHAPDGTVLDTETVTVFGDGSYTTPAGYTIPAVGTVAGTYQWDASYSGDANNQAVSDNNAANEQVVISPALPSLSTTPLITSITLTGSSSAPTISDTATLAGGYHPTGKITFTLTFNGATVHVETVPVNGNGLYPTSAGYTLPTTGIVAGTYQWSAAYSGDSNNAQVSDNGSPTEQVTVTPASPTLTTASSATSVTLGSSGHPVLKDSAVLAGSYHATGAITFALIFNGAPVDTETAAISGDGTYTTPSGYVLPTAGGVTGTYQWVTSYSGDPNNNNVGSDASAASEQTTVSPATPSITTTPSSASVTLGTVPPTLKDTATLSAGYAPTGTLTFTLSFNGQTVHTETITVSGNGIYAVPLGYVIPMTGSITGTYQWNIVYLGDQNNNAASNLNDPAEVVTVHPATPTLTTSVSPAFIALGTSPPGSASDTATLADAFVPTGTITFNAYSDASCGTKVFSSIATVTSTTTSYTSGSFTPASTGSYYWTAVYSGDAQNAGSTGPCGSTGETLMVTRPQISTNPTGAGPGSQVMVSGNGFFPIDTGASLSIGGFIVLNASSCPVSGGSFSCTMLIPASLTSGQYTITATGSPGGESASAAFTVKFPTTLTTSVYDLSTNQQWGGTEVTGAAAYDTSVVTGAAPAQPTGTVTYIFYSGSGSCTGAGTTSTVMITAGAVPNSQAVGPLGAGSYSFQVSYSGDDNYLGSMSTCEQFTVAAAATMTASTVYDAGMSAAWSNNEVTGSKAYDTATVAGVSGFPPTGSLVYTLYSDSSCGKVVATAQVALSGGSVPSSTSTAPLGAGIYSFEAAYQGDTNYQKSQSSCEPFTVARATPTVSTTVFDAATSGAWSGTEVTGALAIDTSSVSTIPSFIPSGTVTYTLYGDGTCTGIGRQSVATISGGSVPSSANTPALGAGSYSFSASYSGDSNFAPATGNCEVFAVAKATPTPATAVHEAATNAIWSGNEVAGASAYDAATVNGVSGFTPLGSVTYRLFADGGCSGTPTMSSSQTLSGGSVPVSASTVPLGVGSYAFQATYGGDANYNSASSACEPFNVQPSPTTTALSCTPNPITIGSSSTCTATVTGYHPGSTVTFSSSSPAGVFTQNAECTLSGGACSVTYLDTAAGKPTISGSYGGDTNNLASKGSTTVTENYKDCSSLVPNNGGTGGENLKGADLEYCNLNGYNLSNANLMGANIQYAGLAGANLMGANLKGANLHGAVLTGSNTAGATLMGADLSNASAENVNFQGDNLMNANLSNGDFTSGQFQGANLMDSTMSYGDFSHANFTGANTKGANTTGANFTGAINPPP
ncbi:MAG TPA: pentapeptide repeat-containing protein [Nitrososphaerales archaeon]|nr:pentapeptide repeat-containing protein [Nitrososphaerales archaeon]